jgi:FkbM family methyltransferase
MVIKKIIKQLLFFLHLDVTKNMRYDRLTLKIMRAVIKENSNCIDIGCHKGEMLEVIQQLAPQGIHYAFEPIPLMYNTLKNQFPKTTIFPYALANENGTATFHFVKNAPAYSGIRKRKYAVHNPDIEVIQVITKRLDEVSEISVPIHFMKIDVEGAEYSVLQGASELLKTSKPLIIFEFGLGASDFYGTNPDELFTFFVNLNYQIYTLSNFIKNKTAFNQKTFIENYERCEEYYFVAKPN